MTSEKRQNTSPNRAGRGVTKRDTPTGTADAVRRKLRAQAAKIGIRVLARQLSVKPGTLSRFLSHDWEPKRADIRKKIGLSCYAPVAVCARCGEAHRAARCTRRKTWAENVAEYSEWKARVAYRLNAIVAWADTK